MFTPTTASDAALDGVPATAAADSPLEQPEPAADELIPAGARTAIPGGAAAARSAPACRFGNASPVRSGRVDDGAPRTRGIAPRPAFAGPEAHLRRAC